MNGTTYERSNENANNTVARITSYHLNRQATNSGQYYPGEDEKHDPGKWPNNLVGWDSEDDPANPINWPIKKKIWVTLLLGFTTTGASFASSSFSPTFMAVSQEFHVSTEVTTLSLSLYALGFAFGPLVSSLHDAGPLLTFNQDVRANIRALWTKAVFPPRLFHFWHFLDCRSDRREHSDCHALSILCGPHGSSYLLTKLLFLFLYGSS